MNGPKVGSKWHIWSGRDAQWARNVTVLAVEGEVIRVQGSEGEREITLDAWARDRAAHRITAYRPARRLTESEEAWRRRLEEVLMAAPPGIGLYTMGDRRLTLYDHARVLQMRKLGIDPEIADGKGGEAGILLGDAASAVKIDAVTG